MISIWTFVKHLDPVHKILTKPRAFKIKLNEKLWIFISSE